MDVGMNKIVEIFWMARYDERLNEEAEFFLR